MSKHSPKVFAADVDGNRSPSPCSPSSPVAVEASSDNEQDARTDTAGSLSSQVLMIANTDGQILAKNGELVYLGHIYNKKTKTSKTMEENVNLEFFHQVYFE